MTAHKHFKQLVRSRMEKTGESYSTARRNVLHKAAPDKTCHFAGSVAAATALRVLLTHAGVRPPGQKLPFSEAMLFGIAGGIGIGVFSFFYEKENVATFYLAGRHLWHDSLAYLTRACERFGITPVIRETSGAKAAEAQLRAALKEQGPCVAWVDATHLPHRAFPESMSGGGYHVITVYEIDDAAGTAFIGDLTDAPVVISLADLAVARSRIKKDKNRLLSIPPSALPKELTALVRDGLKACHAGLTGAGGVRSAATNFSLKAVHTWADRLHGSRDKESWERVFTRGGRLWQGLLSVYDYIENYGTGGGLCRPIFAEFLDEATDACPDLPLADLQARYAELADGWTSLAAAALPDEVPAFRDARELLARKSELTNSGGSPDDIRGAWARLDQLKREACDHFPLSEADCAALRADLQTRVRALHEAEMAAHAALGRAVL